MAQFLSPNTIVLAIQIKFQISRISVHGRLTKHHLRPTTFPNISIDLLRTYIRRLLRYSSLPLREHTRESVILALECKVILHHFASLLSSFYLQRRHLNIDQIFNTQSIWKVAKEKASSITSRLKVDYIATSGVHVENVIGHADIINGTLLM